MLIPGQATRERIKESRQGKRGARVGRRSGCLLYLGERRDRVISRELTGNQPHSAGFGPSRGPVISSTYLIPTYPTYSTYLPRASTTRYPSVTPDPCDHGPPLSVPQFPSPSSSLSACPPASTHPPTHPSIRPLTVVVADSRSPHPALFSHRPKG